MSSTFGFDIRENSDAVRVFFGAFLCGFEVFGPSLRAPPIALCGEREPQRLFEIYI